MLWQKRRMSMDQQPFDIYSALVKRKKQGEDTTLPPVQEFPQVDIDELESFCRSHSILVLRHNEVTNTQIKQILKG